MENSNSSFVTGFLKACKEKDLTDQQIKEAAFKACRLDPAINEEFIKSGWNWGQFFQDATSVGPSAAIGQLTTPGSFWNKLYNTGKDYVDTMMNPAVGANPLLIPIAPVLAAHKNFGEPGNFSDRALNYANSFGMSGWNPSQPVQPQLPKPDLNPQLKVLNQQPSFGNFKTSSVLTKMANIGTAAAVGRTALRAAPAVAKNPGMLARAGGWLKGLFGFGSKIKPLPQSGLQALASKHLGGDVKAMEGLLRNFGGNNVEALANFNSALKHAGGDLSKVVQVGHNLGLTQPIPQTWGQSLKGLGGQAAQIGAWTALPMVGMNGIEALSNKNEQPDQNQQSNQFAQLGQEQGFDPNQFLTNTQLISGIGSYNHAMNNLNKNSLNNFGEAYKYASDEKVLSQRFKKMARFLKKSQPFTPSGDKLIDWKQKQLLLYDPGAINPGETLQQAATRMLNEQRQRANLPQLGKKRAWSLPINPSTVNPVQRPETIVDLSPYYKGNNSVPSQLPSPTKLVAPTGNPSLVNNPQMELPKKPVRPIELDDVLRSQKALPVEKAIPVAPAAKARLPRARQIVTPQTTRNINRVKVVNPVAKPQPGLMARYGKPAAGAAALMAALYGGKKLYDYMGQNANPNALGLYGPQDYNYLNYEFPKSSFAKLAFSTPQFAQPAVNAVQNQASNMSTGASDVWSSLDPNHKMLLAGGGGLAAGALLSQLLSDKTNGYAGPVLGIGGLLAALYGLGGGDIGQILPNAGKLLGIGVNPQQPQQPVINPQQNPLATQAKGISLADASRHPILKRYFGPSGSPNIQTIVQTPDQDLKGHIGLLSPEARQQLNQQISAFKPSPFQSMGARAMGIDVEGQRQRMMNLLKTSSVNRHLKVRAANNRFMFC